MIPKPLRTLGTGAAIILGGILTLNLASSATIRAIRLANEAKRVKLKSKAPFFFFFFFFVCGGTLACLLLRPIFLLGVFGAEKGRIALWRLQRQGVLYMQIVQRECHHKLVAFV